MVASRMGPDELREEEARVRVVLSDRGKTGKPDGMEKSRGEETEATFSGPRAKIRDGWDSQKNVEEQNWPVRMFRYFTEG